MEVIRINKTNIFAYEIGLVKNPTLKEFMGKAIEALPDYFFEVAASSSGKYHPMYATGEGGLVRHTKAAVKFAYELLQLEQNQELFDADMRDMIVIALTLHDGAKHGIPMQKFCVADHPVVVSKYLQEQKPLKGIIPQEQFDTICGLIESHMGQWNTEWGKDKEIMPKPKTPGQKFVHMCDYLASRKWLPVDFEGNEYRPEKEKADESLAARINDIIELCRAKVADGADRASLYGIIKDNNRGNRQPNSIPDIATADRIYKLLKGE